MQRPGPRRRPRTRRRGWRGQQAKTLRTESFPRRFSCRPLREPHRQRQCEVTLVLAPGLEELTKGVGGDGVTKSRHLTSACVVVLNRGIRVLLEQPNQNPNLGHVHELEAQALGLAKA